MFLLELSAQMSVFKIIIQGMIERNPDKRSEIVDVIRTLGEVTQFDIEVSISFIIFIIPLRIKLIIIILNCLTKSAEPAIKLKIINMILIRFNFTFFPDINRS